MNEINRSPAFWRSFAIFEGFDKKSIEDLAEIATYRKWPAGTVIFQRGDEGNYMIVVVSGRIKLSLITPQGRELMLRQHEAGAIFGEMAVLDGQTRSADATAQTAAEGYVIGKKAFLDMVTTRPAAADSSSAFSAPSCATPPSGWKPLRFTTSMPASPGSSWPRSGRSTATNFPKAPTSG